MKELIQGIIRFRTHLSEEKKSLFQRLAEGQKPNALLITCSDSRLDPSLFASTAPGDLFVVRNIGNLVPPATSEDSSVSAAIEFALDFLGVSDIIVCGHSECGAMQVLAEGGDVACCPHVASWIRYGEESLKDSESLDPTLSKHNQLSQSNVLQQMEHLKTYACVQKHLKEKTLGIHGWWFDLSMAEVFGYKRDLNKFVLIDASWLEPAE